MTCKYGGSYVQLKKFNLVPKTFHLVELKSNFMSKNFNLLPKKPPELLEKKKKKKKSSDEKIQNSSE